MRSIQATGKTVDAAIFSGLTQLGLSIDQVTIEVVQHETKGILGIGAKPAVVQLTEKPEDEVVVPDFTKERRERPAGERRERRERREERDTRGEGSEHRGQEAPERGEKGERTEDAEASEKTERTGEHRRSRSRSARKEQPRVVEQIDYSEEEARNEPSAQFVAGLIERMGIEGRVLAARKEDAVRLRVDCTEMGVLIGHRGDTLDSVQYLTSLVVNRNRREDGYTRVTINTEDYREKREETLMRLAKRIAQQVKSSGSPRSLEPMNPYERRIIHSALQKHPFVVTHSEGDEPNRRVVISPKRKGGSRPSREQA